MVFDYGMSEIVSSRTMRADNYALSEETKRLRDGEQARLTDEAYDEAMRLLTKYRGPLDRIAQGLLDRETLVRDRSTSCSKACRASRGLRRPSAPCASCPSPTERR